MKDIFAPIYETWFGLYASKFQLIFKTLHDDGGYIWFGLLFLLVPLLLWLLFYYAWRYPYGKIWHWLICLAITIVLVGASTWGSAHLAIFASDNQSLIDAIADHASGYKEYARTLLWKYTGVNIILTLGVGFIYSLILKQFSKIQIHLPL